MIRISNLNKYYFKNSAKEIHVINDTSLELPTTGLIAFLGKSGCGKTTLLNVIGGLDKANLGTIEYDEDLTLNKYNMKKIDLYRQKNIGYIFQNYLLLEDISVYDNLKIALELIGVYDENEQKARIEYALKAVGMYKYRKKHASRLSGGQQQRVSIARALIKKCKVIIADEPTGNLDNDNTIEVMNILKKISEHTLVLLVTHNPEIASFYANRIITIQDGKVIKDEENVSSGQLTNKNDKKIHLLDFKEQTGNVGNASINIYQNDDVNIDLKLVIKNNTIYIQSSQKVVVAKDNDIEFINDHYQNLKVDDVSNFDFDISWFKESKRKNKIKAFFSMLKESLYNHYHCNKKQRIFHVIFIAIGVAMAFSMISFTKYINVDTSAFPNEELQVINSKDNENFSATPYYSSSVVIDALDKGYIEDVYEYKMFNSNFKYAFNSKRKKNVTISSYAFRYSLSSKLLYGMAPETEKEIVIGKELADTIVQSIEGLDYKQILNQKLGNYTITGISANKTRSIYVKDKYFDLFQSKYNDYDYDTIYKIFPSFYYKDYEKYQIVEGSDIKTEKEVLISTSSPVLANVGEKIQINYDEYTIVGTFKFLNDSDSLHRVYSEYEFITLDKSLLGYIYQGGKGGSQFYASYDYDFSNIEYREEGKDYNLLEGRKPNNKNEAIVNVYSKYKIGDILNDISTLNLVKVVGTYTTESNIVNYGTILINKETYFEKIIQYRVGYVGFKFNKETEAKNYLESNNLIVEDMNKHFYNYVSNDNALSRLTSLIITLALLIACMIYIYFTTRSRLISQIKEVGVYRSIGATKRQIVKSYLSNIFVDTTTTSLLGYIITTLISSYISIKIAKLMGNTPNTNVGVLLIGVVIIYLINFAIGIIPVMSLLNKTPSEINSKYDI